MTDLVISLLAHDRPPSGDPLGDDVLSAQEANRVGTLRVRFDALVQHPLQRPLNKFWASSLAVNHFENGANIQKSANPIMVMAVDPGDVEIVHVSNGLPRVIPSAKFYLISGQHRVAAMKEVIMTRHMIQKRAVVRENEILKDEDAEWPAIVFRNEFETQNTAHFKTFMDSLNVIQNILPNTISQIWATASALTVSKSQYRDSYVKRLIPATTNHRAVIRALNHTALREAVDTLIKIPFFEVTVANFAHWTSLGGFSIWAAILQDAFHSFDRLCGGDESRRSKITVANVFEGKDPRTDDKEGFLKLASKSAGDAVNLWSSFSEHLSSFEERWNILMTRDLSYETLLHEPGTDHAIIPWVLTKQAIVSPTSRVTRWVRDLCAIIQMVTLICDNNHHAFSSVGGRSFDYYDEFESACQKTNGSARAIFQYCAKYHENLLVFLHQLWDRAVHNFVTRTTPTEYKSPLGRTPQTVLEAIPFMLQYDEYWWNLALRLKPRFKDGKFTFASGVVLREQSPNEFKAIDDAAIKAYQEALAAKTNRKKNTQTLSKLKDKLDSISEKTKETTTAIKKVKVLLQKDKKIESQNVQKTKETLIEREEETRILSTPTPSTSPLPGESPSPSPSPPYTASQPLPARVNGGKTALPLEVDMQISEDDLEARKAYSEEYIFANKVVRLPEWVGLLGQDLLVPFAEFLAESLQPSALSMIANGRVCIKPTDQPKKQRQPLRVKAEEVIDLTLFSEDDSDTRSEADSSIGSVGDNDDNVADSRKASKAGTRSSGKRDRGTRGRGTRGRGTRGLGKRPRVKGGASQEATARKPLRKNLWPRVNVSDVNPPADAAAPASTSDPRASPESEDMVLSPPPPPQPSGPSPSGDEPNSIRPQKRRVDDESSEEGPEPKRSRNEEESS